MVFIFWQQLPFQNCYFLEFLICNSQFGPKGECGKMKNWTSQLKEHLSNPGRRKHALISQSPDNMQSGKRFWICPRLPAYYYFNHHFILLYLRRNCCRRLVCQLVAASDPTSTSLIPLSNHPKKNIFYMKKGCNSLDGVDWGLGCMDCRSLAVLGLMLCTRCRACKQQIFLP